MDSVLFLFFFNLGLFVWAKITQVSLKKKKKKDSRFKQNKTEKPKKQNKKIVHQAKEV